jgi:hypothetical protein
MVSRSRSSALAAVTQAPQPAAAPDAWQEEQLAVPGRFHLLLLLLLLLSRMCSRRSSSQRGNLA